MSSPTLSMPACHVVQGRVAGRQREEVGGGVPQVGLRFSLPQDDHFALAWVTALSSFVLAVGILGCFQPGAVWNLTVGGEAGRSGAPDVVETTMAELAEMEQQAPSVAETVMRPEVAVPEAPLEDPVVTELPELLPALTDEDVFVVSTAPPMEKPQTPVDPAPKPVVRKPAESSPSSRSTSTTSTPSRSTAGSGGASSGSGSGTGTLKSGSGGKGSFPQPSYPSYARSRGMQGTVTVTISVGSDGSVRSTSVSGSSGHSTLDQHATSWVRRYWKFPAGAAKTYRVPIVFRLR